MPLRRCLSPHFVNTAFELGWATLSNGDLIIKAEEKFDLLITTDQNLRYQQNLKGKTLSIIVLPTTNWLEIQKNITSLVTVLTNITAGAYVEVIW